MSPIPSPSPARPSLLPALSLALSLEAADDDARSPDLSTSTLSIAKPDWETYCHRVADMIVQEQSAGRVMDVRAKYYELLSHCIPPSVILKVRVSRVCRVGKETLFLMAASDGGQADGRGACGRQGGRASEG